MTTAGGPHFGRLSGRIAARVKRACEAIGDGDIHDTARPLSLLGGAIVLAFFGIFGAWAMVAPLNGAVVATGQVKVDGNRKAIQHPDGGTVTAIRVREGEHVKAGDVLIELDQTQAAAEAQVLEQQYLTLRFTEQRLRAEMSGAARLARPADLTTGWTPIAETLWRSQVELFDARNKSTEGQRGVIREKIEQLNAEARGGEAQIEAYGRQLASLRQELASLKPLVESGIVAKPRYLQLERSSAGLDGQAGEAAATVARARQGIAEQQRLSIQLGVDRASEAAKDLRDTQSKLAELMPKLGAARAVLDRTVIRSPYDGSVVGLTVFSTGGYIARGEKILDLVPEREDLIVEAMINVEDISDVHPGDAAQVHLTAYKQRTLPLIFGTVRQISADRLTDSRSGNPYYTAIVAVDPAELARAPGLKLYPGMPATVTVPTVARSAFAYFVSPLSAAFDRSFRER